MFTKPMGVKLFFSHSSLSSESILFNLPYNIFLAHFSLPEVVYKYFQDFGLDMIVEAR